jgi:peptide/nickel transport system substrate-binding protein
MKRYLIILLLAALAISLLLGGCNSGTSTTAPATTSNATTSAAKPTTAAATSSAVTTAALSTTTAAATPQKGGILKIITNPGLTNIGLPGDTNASNDGSYRQPAFEGLLGYDPKGSGSVVPWLATDYKYSADYTSITFTLRKGVKFHDGSDFNAAAAKFSLELIMNSKYNQDLSSVSSIDAVDDYTIRLNLKQWSSALLPSLASYTCPMVSPNAVKTMPREEILIHPVGTGPFQFTSYQRDVALKYAKFNNYWQPGKPYLDGIEFDFIADSVVQLASFKAGDAQILRQISGKDAAAMQASGKYNFYPQEMAIDCLAGDSAHDTSPFARLKVRQAMAYAIDNNALAKAVGLGYFTGTNQLISQKNLGYNPNIVGYPYNPTKAKQLLAEAGYPNGFDTKLTYRMASFETDWATMIQGYLKAVGINMTLDLADAARFNDMRINGYNNQMMMQTIIQGAEKDMVNAMIDRLSLNATIFTSKTVYIPADYNAKLLEVKTIKDDNARLTALRDVDKMAIDTYLLTIPTQVETSVAAVSTQVKDSDLWVYYAMSYHAENIWLSK